MNWGPTDTEAELGDPWISLFVSKVSQLQEWSVSAVYAISSQISISERAGRQDPDHIFSLGTGPDPKNAENIITCNSRKLKR